MTNQTTIDIHRTATEIIDAIESLSDGLHDSSEWWLEDAKGCYPIDKLRRKIEDVLANAVKAGDQS